MTEENWKNLKEIVSEVLNLPPAERKEFLDKANLSAEIRAEVESLLAYDEVSEDFMNLSAVSFTQDFLLTDQSQESLFGKQIGNYKIISELGIGGMGAVYLGERIDGKFAQKVAIKMLKREFNNEKIRRSFNREKNLLAKLSHANIATLLNTGTTADSIPYLVMEYVDGIPIDKFCLENSLKLNSILKLFNEVCSAVGFAHQNLIVHRDLKPSNILVTKDGKPKLLDFGISKLLDEQNSEENTTTILGAMTPEYASPEQIKGENVTTATDIYSLGMVLFKMLTGNYPYKFEGKSNQNVFKEITESEPEKPSESVFSNLTISANQLKGDIDNIIVKSLSKEPSRRYKTVEQFSDDIWRFIDGIPVLARPATFAYRANKFFRRNKIPVIAGFLIFFSLLSGIAVSTRQTIVAREQARIATESKNLAEHETEHAKTEEEKAKKITAYMSKVFSYANPQWYSEGWRFKGETKVIEAMDDLSDKIDIEFINEADIQAELHHNFAEIYQAVSNPTAPDFLTNERSIKYSKKALQHAHRALELRRQFYGEKHELVAKDMAYLYWTGGVEDKEKSKYLMAAINMMRETNPKNLNLPYMLEDYTSRLLLPKYKENHEQYLRNVLPATVENKYQIAERYLRESLPVFRLHYKEDNQAIFNAECKLSYTLIMQEKWTDFDEHYAICKESRVKLSDADSAKNMKVFLELVDNALAEKNNLR